MKAILLVALLALGIVPLAPVEAAYVCHGHPDRVAVCESYGPGYNCFDVYVLGNNVLNPCLA